MDVNQLIREHADQPLTHQVLISFLKDYRRPNDKIKALKDEGIIEAVKKGLYIAGPSIRSSRPENGLLANHIYGPSYVSLDIALAYYNLIPERVYEITSMTVKASKAFSTPAGVFTYMHLPLPYYAFGLQSIKLSANQHAIIATPEKALCDKIVSTSGILLRSTTQAVAYLTENLRMDKDALKTLDLNMIISWLPDAPKKGSLEILVKTIQNL